MSANPLLSQLQFTRGEYGSTKSMYRSPKNTYKSETKSIVHGVRGIGTNFVSKGKLGKK